MNEKEFHEYIKGLKAANVLLKIVNEYLKSKGCRQQIGNCWLDSSGKYARFYFQIDGIDKKQTATDFLSKFYKGEDE